MSTFQEWLDSDDAARCTLVKVQNVFDGSTSSTFYLSNKNYISDGTGLAGEIPANTQFIPVISTSISFSESITIDYQPNISFGDLEIDNNDGSLDSWLDYVWGNRQVDIYFGPLDGATSDFTKIFSGTTSDISSSGIGSINLGIRSIMQRINTPITEYRLGDAISSMGTTAEASLSYGTKGTANQNKGALRPVCFGEVHNITPLLTDDTILEYMIHYGPIKNIIEVRDNGVPVLFEPNLSMGTFTLARAPKGVITCSAQGDNYAGIYSNTIATIIKRITTGFGKQDTVLLTSDLDMTNFNAFDTANPQVVGVFLNSTTNIINICQDLAASVGAQITANRAGKLVLRKIDLPASPTISRVVDDNYIFQNSLHISNLPTVKANVKLGYCKNYTVQTNLLTGIPQEHKDLFGKDYLVATAVSTDTKSLYKISTDSEQINTLLVNNRTGSVTAEAQRQLDLFKIQRVIFTMECTPSVLTLNVGDFITLQHIRYNLSSGVLGQVIGMQTNLDTGIVQLEVLT